MPQNTNSKTQKAKSWLKPNQVEKLRDAAYSDKIPTYLQSRNEVLVALMYDTGLRVSELIQLDKSNIHFENSELFLPGSIQKDYPIEGKSPGPVYLDLKLNGIERTLRNYLNNRWKDPKALFPSRQSDRMTKESVRNVITNLSEIAEINPILVDGSRGDPSDVSPHTLRHSVAYRMLRIENNRLIDVRDRLRHQSISTTERVYEHFKIR